MSPDSELACRENRPEPTAIHLELMVPSYHFFFVQWIKAEQAESNLSVMKYGRRNDRKAGTGHVQPLAIRVIIDYALD